MLGLRELDFHARFTAENVTRLTYYGEASVPFGERLVAGIVIAGVIVGLIAYAIAYAPRLRAALRGRSPAGFSVLTVVVLLPVTKVIDRLPNRLEEASVMVMERATRLHFSALEEILELAIPVILVLALAQMQRRGA